MNPIHLASVAALLFAASAQADSAASSSASSAAKPTAAAPTVAQVKPPTPQQQKAALCNTEAVTRNLSGEARLKFVAECLKAP